MSNKGPAKTQGYRGWTSMGVDYDNHERIHDLSTRERAIYIDNWYSDNYEYDSHPTTTIAEEFDVSTEVADRWVEPLRDFWTGTFIEPFGKGERRMYGEYMSNVIGSSKLSMIRDMSEDAGDGNWFCICTARRGLTLEYLQEVKEESDNFTDRDVIIDGMFDKEDF